MAGTLTQFDLSQLPAPTVVETLDFEQIFSEMLADFRTRDPAFTAVVESDPAYKILEVAAYRELILRQRINDTARRRLLAFANDGDLDQLAAFYGLQRLIVTPADDTVYPPIVEVKETDAVFRTRVRERIMGSSSAGTASWYRYHAMTASGTVRDAAVDSPGGGQVRVSVLSSVGDGTASAELLATVSDVVLSPSVRGLCHDVTVVSAEIITVDVEANLTLLPSANVGVLPDIEATLRAAVLASVGLGWDVTQSWLIARLQAVGVHHVELVGPAENIHVAPFQCVSIGTVTLNYVGRDQ